MVVLRLLISLLGSTFLVAFNGFSVNQMNGFIQTGASEVQALSADGLHQCCHPALWTKMAMLSAQAQPVGVYSHPEIFQALDRAHRVSSSKLEALWVTVYPSGPECLFTVCIATLAHSA